MNTAICAIAKNENDYINDWCKWHLSIGIDKIYIFDNNDINSEYVGNCIDKDILDRITIIPVNNFKEFQKQAYNDFYYNFSMFYDWIAFIDIDEFINVKCNDIKTLLSTIPKNINVVRLNWQIYGDDHGSASSDISVPVYERITEKLNRTYNMHGKSIVRGKLNNVKFNSVHYPTIDNKMPSQCLPSGKQLTDDSKIVLSTCEYDIAYLAHYMTKTYSEFVKQKLNRTDAALKRTLQKDYFFNINPR